MRVIPNYVDLAAFQPSSRDANPSRVVILYPRQLYAARGMYLVLEVMDAILSRYPQAEFRFVGRGGEGDTKHVVDKIKQWPGRVRWDALSLEEMPDAYREADISLIPTLHSEGTSLSCLEAMACGNAVIATRVGGLTDLVIHGYSGYLIEPHADTLQQAVVSLLENPELRRRFQQRGVEVAQAFAKEGWLRSWSELLDRRIDAHKKPSAAPGRLIEIRMSRNPGDVDQLGSIVCGYLRQGDLVYLRVDRQPADPARSYGRVQWLGWDEPVFSEPDIILDMDPEQEGAMEYAD